MNQKYALVRWCGGSYDKTYTTDIPIEWIRGFDYEAYEGDDFDFQEVYTIEWRDTTKCPRGGWKLYDAYVITVSEKKKVLAQKLQVLDELNTPSRRLSLDEINTQAFDRESIKKSSPKSKRVKSNDKSTALNRKRSHETAALHFDDLNAKESDGKFMKQPRISTTNNQNYAQSAANKIKTGDEAFRKVADEIWNDIQKDMKTSDDDVLSDVIELSAVDAKNDENSEPKTDSEQMLSLVSNKDLMKKLNVISHDISDIKKLLQQMGSIDDGQSSQPKTLSETGKPFKKGEFYVGQIEIGKPGSGIKVDELQWVTAVSKNSPTHMVKTLLPCLFDLEVLLDSNYKGGAPKNKIAGDATVQRKRLDPKIIEAWKYTINKTYPGQMNDSAFGQAVNSKITSLRYQVNQQVNNKQKNLSTDD